MDGLRLRCKDVTKENRNNKRQSYGARLSDHGIDNYDEDEEDAAQLAVYKKYSEEITRENYYMFIDFLKHKNVKFMIAPYEADSQLAYLYHAKIIDYILSEDSDLVAYGCFRIIRSIKKNGDCKIMNIKRDLPKNASPALDLFRKISIDDLTRCCILAGCDYLQNIKGIGFLSLLQYVFTKEGLMKNIKTYAVKKKKRMTAEEFDEYVENFEKVYLTFTEQLVYCPLKERIVNLSSHKNIKSHNPLKASDTDYIGSPIKHEKKFINGEIDFDDLTKERKPQKVDFDRILKFFKYKPDFVTGRIGNLTNILVTFENFDKKVDEDAEMYNSSILDKKNHINSKNITAAILKHDDNATEDTHHDTSVSEESTEAYKKVKTH